MDNEQLLQAITDMIDAKLATINDKLDRVEVRLSKVERKIDDLDLSSKLLERNVSKKLSRLQDGMDTVEEILKLNEMIPR